MKVKAYLHETYCDRNRTEVSIILVSKEFGWLEYYEDDITASFQWKNKKDMIENSYRPNGKEFEAFSKYGNLTYLGEL